ncbi:MAG: hypothetical protein AAF430_10900 [Myxococcota bacterium]
MALTSRITGVAPSTELSTIETAVVTVEVGNTGIEPVVIDHATHRCALELRDAAGECVLTIDESLRARLLYSRGLAEPPQPVQIPAGESVELVFDLAQYYYPLASGDYELGSVTIAPDEPARPGDAPVSLRCRAVEIDEVQVWYENPIFGTQSQLCRATDANGSAATRLRWLGLNQPRAAFFDRSIEAPEAGRWVPAVAAFWDPEDMEQGLTKVLVQDCGEGRLRVHRTLSGRSDAPVREIRLPNPTPLLPFAFRTAEEAVFVFCVTGDPGERHLCGFRLPAEGAPEACLDHRLGPEPAPLAVCGGPDLIHVLESGTELTHTLYDHDGTEVQTRALHSSEGTPCHLYANLAEGVVRAAWQKNDALGLVETGFAPYRGPAPAVRAVTLALEASDDVVRELDFRLDLRGGPVALWVTADDRLRFRDGAERVHELSQGERRYHPRILVGEPEIETPMLGFWTRQRGYRFVPGVGDDVGASLRAVRV